MSSVPPELVARRRSESSQRIVRWLRSTTPAPDPKDVNVLLDWIDDLRVEVRGLREDLLECVERKIPA